MVGRAVGRTQTTRRTKRTWRSIVEFVSKDRVPPPPVRAATLWCVRGAASRVFALRSSSLRTAAARVPFHVLVSPSSSPSLNLQEAMYLTVSVSKAALPLRGPRLGRARLSAVSCRPVVAVTCDSTPSPFPGAPERSATFTLAVNALAEATQQPREWCESKVESWVPLLSAFTDNSEAPDDIFYGLGRRTSKDGLAHLARMPDAELARRVDALSCVCPPSWSVPELVADLGAEALLQPEAPARLDALFALAYGEDLPRDPLDEMAWVLHAHPQLVTKYSPDVVAQAVSKVMDKHGSGRVPALDVLDLLLEFPKELEEALPPSGAL